MNDQSIKEHLKKLQDRRAPNLSAASKKVSLILGILFLIWGVSLIVLMRGNMYHPAMTPAHNIARNIANPVTLITIAILLVSVILLSGAYEKKDYFASIYDPFTKARKHLKKTLFIILFFAFFLPSFYLAFPRGFFSILIYYFIVAAISMIFMSIKEYIKFKVNNKTYGKSKIQLLEQPLVLGGKLRIRFENQSSILTGKRLKASLRNISEIEKKISRYSEEARSVEVFQRYEKVIHFVMEEPQKMLSFQIPKRDTVPTNIVGFEPDYWELEIREEEGPYFSRFLLDIN